jgi:hypothetical protein
LLAKPSPLNINLGSDRFSMFNKKAGHPRQISLTGSAWLNRSDHRGRSRPVCGGTRVHMARAKNGIWVWGGVFLNELRCEPGVGHVTVAEIQLWLEERGASLRSSQ